MMGSFLGFLCVLSALMALGFSLTCKRCVSSNSLSCSGTSRMCPPDNACGSTRTTTTANGITVTDRYEMSCVPKARCNIPGSISFPNSNTKMGTSCCYTDDCTPPTPTLPGDNYQPNGLTCPYCVSATSDWCYTEDTMQCTGSEDMCVFQLTNMNGPTKQSVSPWGCATKSFCSVGTQTAIYDNVDMKAPYSCSSGSFGLRSRPIVSFILAVAVAVILK